MTKARTDAITLTRAQPIAKGKTQIWQRTARRSGSVERRSAPAQAHFDPVNMGPKLLKEAQDH